uniref:hypothetical protein n=1 Tax=Candidatus Fimenecus sp. TaxID=3022888 RepID=UPI0040250809
MKNKKIILALALTVLFVCSMSLALTANADTTTVPTDLRNVKVGDDLSGATIYVDYSKLSTSFLKTALYTSSYAIYQETASGRQFCYGRASQAGSPSGTIKAWATPTDLRDFQTGTMSTVWRNVSSADEILTGIVSYTLPSDFGKVTSVNDASMLFVSASEFSAFKGKTFDDGIPVYAGLELKNTMFAVKKPTFTKTFVQMSGSSDLVRVNLFTTTYSQLIRTNADDIILRYSTNGGMTFTEKYLWNSMSNTGDDIVYFEYEGYGVVSASNFLSETTSWLRVVTLEKYTVKFVDTYGNDSSTVTKNRGETISLPYISQSTTPLMTYSWVCDKTVSDNHIAEDRTYTKTMYINGDKVLTDYIGNVKTLNDGFPSSLKFYLVQRSNKYGVYVGISDLQNIISDKVLEGDKTTSKFVLKLHSLKTDEQNTNYLQARMTYDQVVDSTVGAKDDLYWYLLDDFTEEVGTFTPSSFAQVQLTVTMTFDEVIFDGNVTVPVQIYGNVTELRNVNIEVPCKKYYNGDIDLKLPVNFWTDYPELQVDDILIHKFVFEQSQNTNWILSDGYYVAKTIDTLSLKQETSDFTFTNNINDKTMTFPINIDDDGNYYVTIMLDNPLQVNSDEFLANNGWRDKFDGMSTLTDLRYCTDEAKAFIRSMLLCDNYANYNFGESGYYITALPGHTVYSNTVGNISSVVGIKVYITTLMLTEYGKTYRLTLVSEEEYTKEES